MHSYSYSISGDTITKTCTAEGCPGGVGGTATLTGALAATFDCNAHGLTATVANQANDGVSAAITYSCGSAPVNAGTYQVTMAVDGGTAENSTITRDLVISPATIDSVSFNPASQNYDGSAKSTAMTVKAGTLTLDAGDYDITAGTLSGVVGSPAEDVTTTVTVQGKGNFTGEKSASWTIVAPSGSFAANAASGTGCTASGTSVELTDSLALNPTYDSEKGTWKVAMTVTWPAPVTKGYTGSDYGTATYIDAAHAFVEMDGSVYSGTQVLNNEADGLTATTGSGSYSYSLLGGKRSFTYFNSLTYTLEFSVADVDAAKAAGKIEKSITVWSIIWQGGDNNTCGSATGLKATTYTLTIPIDDKLILQDTEGRQVYPEHRHSWSYEIVDGGKTLKATCQAQGCPQETLSFGFTGATNKVYDAEAFVAELTDSTEFVKHTGAAIGKISYSETILHAAGTYQASVVVTVGGQDYTLVETYTIDPRPLTSLTLSATSFDYDAAEKSVSIPNNGVMADTFGLSVGSDYDIVEGSVLAEKGSGTENKTYTVTVQGKNNFCGTASATWTIKAPTGSVGAMTAVGGGCAVDQSDAKKVIVTDSTALTYSADEKKWSVGLNVAIPSSNIGGITDPTCTFPDDLFVTVSSNAVQVTKNSKYNDGASRKYHYMTSVDAVVWFSVADVLAAKAAELKVMEYTVTMFARKGKYNSSGLKEVTYVISIPLEGLVLNDEKGIQVYPEHQHRWTVTKYGENILTASCDVAGCPQSPLTLALAAVSRDYNGAAFAATLTGADDFRTHVGATVGDITYWAGETQLGSAPKYTGSYEAQVVATVLGETYTLKAPFAITKPAGGYTSGWELAKQGVEESKWVRYDTCTEATANADDGDTIVYHSGYNGEDRQLAVTSDRNVTIDLNGKTLQRGINGDFELFNGGSGVITLVNGTIKQPTKNLDVGDVVFIGAEGKSGSFVLGAGLTLENAAWVSGSYLQVGANRIGLEIIGGQYQIRGFGLENGGSISITGGQFWSNFNPSAYVAQGYVVQEIEGDYKYEVVKASEALEEYVMNVTGGDRDDVVDWLTNKVSNLEAVKSCAYLTASFELDVDLITDATTVDITDFSMSDGFTFTITLDKGATPVVIKRAAEKIASRIRVTDALGADFAAVDVERLTVDTGSGTVKVAPKTGATSEFLKIVIEKDAK